MAAWATVRIDQIGRVVTGKTPPSERPDEFGDVYPFVTPSDIPATQKHIAVERYLSEQGMESHKRIQLPRKAVCVVCIGATVGKTCMTDQPSISNQQINSIIPAKGKHDPDFVYYISTTLRDSLVSFAGGAATPIVNKSTFSSIKLLVPEFDVQRKIAAILSAYDELIKNNQRRIALLEKMAEEIYREWFVRLRFPGHDKVKVIKGVPEGWRQRKISDFAECKYGYTESAVLDDELPKFLRVMDINKSSFISWSEVPNCPISDLEFHKLKLAQNDVVIARMADPGKVAIVEQNVNAVFASYLIKIAYDQAKITPYYLFYTLRTEAYSGYFSGANSGATRGSINGTLIGKTKILVPNRELLDQFENFVRPIREQLNNYVREIEKHSLIRNQLLPRLISGKLSVENLDIQFPPSMAEEAHA